MDEDLIIKKACVNFMIIEASVQTATLDNIIVDEVPSGYRVEVIGRYRFITKNELYYYINEVRLELIKSIREERINKIIKD